jgi:L-2-hydroxyglutarate oxidase LhgO
MSADVETVVIGAGVIGLSVARSLALERHQVLVLEQHEAIGTETSSRNSEVIHAGIYYPPGSLRARLCVEGKEQLYRFCAANGVGHKRCGKLLVATAPDQTAKLEAIGRNARENGVEDLIPLSPAEVGRIEAEVACVAALLSPSTGIVDSHGLMLALQGNAEAQGAEVVLRSVVTRLEVSGPQQFVLEIGGENRITCRNLVIAAGLHASKLAGMLSFDSGYRPPPTYYAKGQYYALSGRSPFARHVYPMPQGAWLGLHATVDLSGRCKFGPDIAWTPEIDYQFEPEKLGQFLDFIRSYYPGLAAERLHADYIGVRPKLYREGEPVADFAIHGPAAHGQAGLVMLFGIESPGLTAALAIGDYVARLLTEND